MFGIWSLHDTMSRIKRGVAAQKKHKKILRRARGYRGSRKTVFRLAKQAVLKAGVYAYRDRRRKKRDFRRLWTIKINAASRKQGLTYSKFVSGLKKAGIELDRKVLAAMAVHYPEEFSKLVEKVKNSSSV